MKIIKVLLFLFFLQSHVSAQQNVLDSLDIVLRQTKSDTARIRLYVEKIFAAEDSSTVLYSDTAISLINKLLPGASRQMSKNLQQYWAIGRVQKH